MFSRRLRLFAPPRVTEASGPDGEGRLIYVCTDWRYIQGLLGFKLDQLEDPEILLQQAQQEMRENQAKNRERAVQAITQKNNLQAEVEKTQKIVDNLQAKAELALKNGDRDVARQLLIEKGQYGTTLTTIRQSLQSAMETTEAIKVAIRREEERIRAKTAQAMAMKTQWKQSQIEKSFNKALDGMTGRHGRRVRPGGGQDLQRP